MRFACSISIGWLASALCVHAQALLPTVSVRLDPTADVYLKKLPTWSGGALIVIEKNGTETPVIHSFDASGAELTPIAVTLPDSKPIQIEGVARAADGAYAIVGRVVFGPQKPGPGFIRWISPDRQTVRTAQPFPYVPHMVTIAPDGSIWTVGAETVNGFERDPAVNKSHGVVRHFDTKGAEIASFIPRSEVFHGKWLGLPQGEIASNRDRIGWYARIAQQYTEVTFDGKVTSYPGIFPPESTSYTFGLALLDNGDVIASTLQPNALYRLDRSSRTWAAIPVPSSAMPNIRGSDGRQIMLAGKENGLYQLVSVDPRP